MSDPQPTVLVTGANGFVGSRLCRRFLADGFAVYAGVRRSSDLSLLNELPVEYRYGDVTEPSAMAEVVAGVDYVVHNAGVVKAKRLQTFFDINEGGTQTVCDAVQRHNPQVKKLLYISSLAAAGPSTDGVPVTEADEPHPITVYGESKLAGERTALSYGDRFHAVAVRPPGIYGPGDKEIFAFFQAVNRRIRPLVGDPSRKIQIVHVDDLCRGVSLALRGTTHPGESYFIAEDRSYTMRELVSALGAAVGRRGVPLRLPGTAFKVVAALSEAAFKLVGATPMLTRDKAAELLASWEISTEKAHRAFGYESRIPFARGARETVEWYRKEGWLK